MEDERILELFFSRDERAIAAVQEKYGRYCMSITKNILDCDEDAEECANDVFLKLWQSIPPARPKNFKAFVGTTARRTALDVYRRRAKEAEKYPRLKEALEELSECLGTSEEDPEKRLVRRETVNGFLASLKAKERQIFMRRYFYMCTTSEIAQACRMKESAVKASLLRTRNKLKEYLSKEGYEI